MLHPREKKSLILCRSKARAAKEKAIHERFEQRIEKRLEKLVAVCQAKKHKVGLIEWWVGWILGANGRAAGLFKVAVSKREDDGASVKWQKVEEWRQWAKQNEGCYLLRSNIADWEAEELCQAYIQEIAQIKVVDVVMPTKQGAVIRRRCIAQPTKAQATLLQRLQLPLPQRMRMHEM